MTKSQQWEETVSWAEGNTKECCILRIRRKADGKKDHLIAFLVDDATGREFRVAKYEVASGKLLRNPAKGILDTWDCWNSLSALLDAVESLIIRIAARLLPGSPEES